MRRRGEVFAALFVGATVSEDHPRVRAALRAFLADWLAIAPWSGSLRDFDTGPGPVTSAPVDLPGKVRPN